MSAPANPSNVQLRLRPSSERGHADHGWLKTYPSFSFADYYDPRHAEFGPLRVINEDLVEPSQGFGKHSHREFEIFSYVLSGQLQHKDSLGGNELLERGCLQMTSTGTGISHSEFNGSDKEPVRFLQMWCKPNQSGLKPGYYARKFTDEAKRDTLLKIVAPIGDSDVRDEREAEGPTPIHAEMTVYASILSPGASVSRVLADNTKRAYVKLVMMDGYRAPRDPAPPASFNVGVQGGSQLALTGGDGIYVDAPPASIAGAELEFTNSSDKDAEFLLFEMSS